MLLYNEFKALRGFFGSIFFDSIILQLFYAACCIVCGVFLGSNKVLVKFVLVVNLVMFCFPLVFFSLVQKSIMFGKIDFLKYELCLSLIFLYTMHELVSYKKLWKANDKRS